MEIAILIPILLGLISGWTVNYFADVLPQTRRLSPPVCPACGSALGAGDYLLQQKCRSCGQARGPRALIVLLGMPLLMLAIWFFPRAWIPFPLSALIVTYFALVMVIDLEHRLILNPVSLVGLLLGLGAGLYLRGSESLLHGLLSTLAGGAAGFGIMLVFYYIGTLYVRKMAQRQRVSADEVALGFGDVNLAGIIGLLLGWPAIFASLFFSILGGGIISLLIILVMLLRRRFKAFTAIPYAPFLILGACYLLFILP